MEGILIAGAIVLAIVVLGVAIMAWQIGNLRGQIKRGAAGGGAAALSVAPRSHTHTYKVNSAHEEQGHTVKVKLCECGDVVREVDA
jgi:hypothetical protein